MKWLIVMLLVLMAGSVSAADVVVSDSVGYTSKYGGTFLGIGRFRGGCAGDTCILGPTKNGANQSGWLITTDTGHTIDDTQTGQPDGDNYADDHASWWFAPGVGLFYAGRASGYGSAIRYRHFSSPYGAGDGTSYVDVQGNCYYSNVVAHQGSDTVWIFRLPDDQDSSIVAYVSTNNFTSYDTVVITTPAHDAPTSNGTLRINTTMDTLGNPSCLVFMADGDGAVEERFYECRWNGSGFDSVDVYVSTSLGPNDRSYTHTFMAGRLHMVWWDDSEDDLFHVWDTTGSKEYKSEKMSDITITGEWANPALTVYNDGPNARLYCFFNVDDPTGGIMTVMKSWCCEDSGWVDSTVVTDTTTTLVHFAAPPYVSTDWGTIPCAYGASTGDLYFVKVEAAVYGTEPEEPVLKVRIRK